MTLRDWRGPKNRMLESQGSLHLAAGPGRALRASIIAMRPGVHMFLMWSVPVATVGTLCYLAYSRRSSSGRSLHRR